MHAERASGPRTFAAWTLPWSGLPPHHRVKLQLVDAVLPGGMVVVGRVPHHGNRPLRVEHYVFEHVGQVLRAIELLFIEGGHFNLHGDVLEQSSWLHAVRARIAAPEQRHADVPGLRRQRQHHPFLRGIGGAAPFVRTVAVDERPTVIRTYQRWRE